MPTFLDFLVVIGMVALRFGVPALVLAALVFGLKRLDRRWEAEAHDYAANHPEARPAVQPTAPRPAAPIRTPAPAKEPTLPFVIPPTIKEQRIQPGVMAEPGVMAGGQPARGETKKALCSAPQNGEQPCWQVRFNAEGHIPEECVKCDVFQRYPTV